MAAGGSVNMHNLTARGTQIQAKASVSIHNATQVDWKTYKNEYERMSGCVRHMMDCCFVGAGM